MNLTHLKDVLATEPKYRYDQVNRAIFQDYISDWTEVSNLPKGLRETLIKSCPLEINGEIHQAVGGRSEKALLTLADEEVVETVLIRHKDQRNTICLSAQVGCPLACTFCATGQLGFKRNLLSAEIVEQFIFWARYLKQEGTVEKIDNVVFMGMGEPFLNYAEFIKAAKFLNNPETIGLGSRRLSVSTAGVLEGIKRLAGEKLQINLAISLHAANDVLRRDLMPVARKYALDDLIRAVDDYIRKTGRRVMFEYLLLKGVNDSDQDALQLAKLMKKPLYLVNLIPYNPTGCFQASSRERIQKFKEILEDQGVAATVRLSFGADIAAACGQLGKKLSK